MPQTAPFVFLSHSGADTGAARDLKRRLLESPDARAAGLKVWFDKDDLRAGQWQPQIEQAIVNEATAFFVYVGSRGVVNWIDIEVRTALSRAATDKAFLFIPLIAAEGAAAALPPSPSFIKPCTIRLGTCRRSRTFSRRFSTSIGARRL
jgi:TIR domain